MKNSPVATPRERFSDEGVLGGGWEEEERIEEGRVRQGAAGPRKRRWRRSETEGRRAAAAEERAKDMSRRVEDGGPLNRERISRRVFRLL